MSMRIKKFMQSQLFPSAVLTLLVGVALGGANTALVYAETGEKTQVTNGGYMQTQTSDGQAVVLPLKHTDVQAEVAGFVASVQVTQHFQNPSKKPIEAIYVFPLPHRSAIYDMTIQVGKRTIKGIVKKRQEARQIYDQAKAAGKTAALLEQERPNIFTQSIANILPGDQIKVTLRYVEDLAPEGGRYEFSFPMVVGPRYVGGGEPINTQSGKGWGKDTDRIPDASRITPKLLAKGLRPGNDIAVRLRINGGVKIQNLHVVTHKAKVQNNNGSYATVELDKSDAIPNKDFVVRYQLAGQRPEVTVLPQRDGRGGHFLLMIQPKMHMGPSDIAPREYIFVIDRSGSQWGFPLEQSKAVVRKSLANVGPNDTFNLIQFESSAAAFAPKAVSATKANVQAALSWVNRLQGGGGTEFLPALELALNAPKDPSRSRIVLFMTDGYIGYENQVLKYLRDHAKGINVFALGVGSSVNRFLIDGMARIGVGTPFYLLNTEKPEKVVERIFSTISKPSLTNIEIDWNGLDVEEMTPGAVPDLFGEQPVFVAGRYGRGGSATVVVRGRLAGKPFNYKVAVNLPDQPTSSNTAVAYLWARRQIADLSDWGAIEPSRIKEVEQSITEIALKYNLMSQYTSFVAVDQVVRNKNGKQETVAVPVPLPEGVSEHAAPPGAFMKGGASRRMMPVAPSSVDRRYSVMPAPNKQMLIRPRATERDEEEAKDLVAPAEKLKKADKERRSTSEVGATRALELRLGNDLRVSGKVSPASIQQQLKSQLKSLAPKLRSLGPKQTGQLVLRLTLDKSGAVKQIAFVSGNLLHPSLKAELKHHMQTWRFTSVTTETTVSFTLIFAR